MTETILLRKNRIDLQQLQSSLPTVSEEHDNDVDLHSKTTSNQYERVRDEIREFLLTHHAKLLQEALVNPKRKPEFERIVRSFVQMERKIVQGMTVDDIVQRAWKDLCSLGPLDDVFKSNDFTEIMLNGFNQPWVQLGGKDVPALDLITFDSPEHLMNTVITKILNSCGKSISEAKPIVDARIGDARVNIVASPISQMRGPIVSIRKFPPMSLTPEGFLGYGTASEEMLAFIKLAVEGECSIVMGGATGSGKTTSYKMMAGFIPKGQRTLVIEDTAEMRLEVLYPYEEGYHFLSEECRYMGDEQLDVTIQKLVAEAGMRQKPHRFIIGEIRRGEDLLAALDACESGHATWWTMHGRSAKHLFSRIVAKMTKADPAMTRQNAMEQLADSLDIIMMQKLFKEDKKRRVFEIVEVAGMDEDGKAKLIPIFEYDWETKQFYRRNPISEKLVEIFRNAEIPRHRYESFLNPAE